MKLIIPMAGLGKRMRPHTLGTPKPLLKIAGISIVERIIREFSRCSGKTVDEIHYVIGEFGKEVEEMLKTIARDVGAKAYIYHQTEALGTAHAIYCAGQGLSGEVCIAFADTLYFGDIRIDDSDEAIIWTFKVDNPESYGVVLTGEDNLITEFREKPKDRVSDMAIVGMYYFKEGNLLERNLRLLLDAKRMVNGEYQLTDALKDMLSEGVKFRAKALDEWLDFGSKSNFLESIGKFLMINNCTQIVSGDSCIFVPPVYIGKNVELDNCSLGPNVIIEDGSTISFSLLENTVIGANSNITNSKLKDSLVGSYCSISGYEGVLNLGDYNEIEK